MSIEEIIQYCALNGISLLFRRPALELSEEDRQRAEGLPYGVDSVLDALRMTNFIELVFTIPGRSGERLSWHTVLSTEIATDPGAFPAAFTLGFYNFCKAARIAPRPSATLWGFPILTDEEGFRP